jgi:hypothetical protein
MAAMMATIALITTTTTIITTITTRIDRSCSDGAPHRRKPVRFFFASLISLPRAALLA